MEDPKTFYFPFVRKGLSSYLSEEDTLGGVNKANEPVKNRPALEVTATYKVTLPSEKQTEDTGEHIKETYEKTVHFVGPGDILDVSPNAIMKVMPIPGSSDFPNNYIPYIEFWEPDFPWRYTPAIPTEDKRLRPWLALIACETKQCILQKMNDGRTFVTLKIQDPKEYAKIFPDPTHTWKTAHAQGATEDEPEFARLLALNSERSEGEGFEPGEEYFVFLIPVFETGRLRGLGYDDRKLNDIQAQAPAWEKTLGEQREKHPVQPLDFPVYYSWKFTAGADTFREMVKRLSIKENFDSDIKVEVTRMGEGLDFDCLDPQTPKLCEVIGMPAATLTLGYKQEPSFPYKPVKKTATPALYYNLRALLSQSPTLVENQIEINDPDAGVDVGDDDPFVVPPLYGARHIMATSIDESVNEQNNTAWFTQLNLDIHYRAVAGLGKKTVQVHQEDLVARAWKQVEAVNILNQALRQRLLSVNTNHALTAKTVRRPGMADKGRLDPYLDEHDSQFAASMMRNFYSLKKAKTKKTKDPTTLFSWMNDSGIPSSFASASSQQLLDDAAKLLPDINQDDIMVSIANRQIIRMDSHEICNAPRLQNIKNTLDDIFTVLAYHKFVKEFRRYFSITEKTGSIPMSDLKAKTFGNIFTIFKKKQIKLSNEIKDQFHLLTPERQREIEEIVMPHSHLNYYRNFVDFSLFSFALESSEFKSMLETAFGTTKLKEFINDMFSHEKIIASNTYLSPINDKFLQSINYSNAIPNTLHYYYLKFEILGKLSEAYKIHNIGSIVRNVIGGNTTPAWSEEKIKASAQTDITSYFSDSKTSLQDKVSNLPSELDKLLLSKLIIKSLPMIWNDSELRKPIYESIFRKIEEFFEKRLDQHACYGCTLGNAEGGIP